MNMRAEEFIQLDEAGWKQKLAGAAMAGSLALGSTSTATQTEPPAPKVDPAEQLVLAQTMWGEARNDGIEGMRAVGHVIMNRIDSSQANFGSDVESVAKKRKQFSV